MKTVTANGLTFAVLEQGSGPLVLMLHGFPDTAHTWDAALPALAARGYRVAAPFMRGYAPTEIPATEDFGADTLGRDVLALIEALGEQRAIVVGHDWGAFAAYAAAALAPERLKLLVTVGIPHPASMMPTWRNLKAGRHFLSLRRKHAAEMVRANDFAHVDVLVRRWSREWQFGPDELAHVKAAFAQPGCLEAALGYYRGVGLRLPKTHWTKIAVPSVAFAGLSDQILPSQYEGARGRFTGAYQVVTMPGGHFMHREHPQRFIDELLAVLEPHRAGPASP